MYLLLIRHLESQKNVHEAFSSDADTEPLTLDAQRELKSWAMVVAEWIQVSGLTTRRVHSTASRRAEDTATGLAELLGVPIVTHERLRSTHPGVLAGKSATEAQQTNPEFMEQLRLYRQGLFNAYEFKVAESKEPKRDFDARIAACIAEIMNADDDDLKVVVSHRAPITTTLIAAARSGYRYPDNFFGYVELALGHVSLLERSTLGTWKIHSVNTPPRGLPRMPV
jgi:broad specificity phosphatase PhoE